MRKKLGFGCMRLPVTVRNGREEIDYRELESMVDLFLEQGYTYFDTAYTYHDGQCEEALRKALVERYPRDRFTLTDKLPTLLLEDEMQQERIFAEQLRRCGVQWFDRYLVHCATKAFYEKAQQFRSFEFALQKRRDGFVRQVGFSFHDSPELLEEILERYPDIDFIQLQISYMDWNNSPIQARRCYEIARRARKPVVVMCPLKGGMLVHPPQAIEKRLREARPEWSAATWAIRFAASLDGVETVLSGMSSLEQMRRNIAGLEGFTGLEERDYAVLNEAARLNARLTPIQCTTCGYCLPVCPAHIPIPTDLGLLNEDVADDGKGIENRRKSYRALSQGLGRASDCIECYRCENACPQHIHITGWLKRAVERFEAVPEPVLP